MILLFIEARVVGLVDLVPLKPDAGLTALAAGPHHPPKQDLIRVLWLPSSAAPNCWRDRTEEHLTWSRTKYSLLEGGQLCSRPFPEELSVGNMSQLCTRHVESCGWPSHCPGTNSQDLGTGPWQQKEPCSQSCRHRWCCLSYSEWEGLVESTLNFIFKLQVFWLCLR